MLFHASAMSSYTVRVQRTVDPPPFAIATLRTTTGSTEYSAVCQFYKTFNKNHRVLAASSYGVLPCTPTVPMIHWGPLIPHAASQITLQHRNA